ncbi:MAG: SLC13 family permease [Candidatus Hadarchaeota archaeon]
MMDHWVVFITIGVALALFTWGKIRYDIVSIIALMTLVVWGIVPAEDAFIGFGHPAVITVAAVLIVSRALQNSGLIDVIAGRLMNLGDSLLIQIGVLCGLVSITSAFINNIGAIAVMMPVAIQLARKNNTPPSYVLMPIAFSSILGGTMTLIGTPPNIVIATFRKAEIGSAFGMFDFSPVGVGITIIGIGFITLLGWRLLPRRRGEASEEDKFGIEDYTTEVRIKSDSEIKGKTLGELKEVTQADINLLGLIRNKQRIHTPEPRFELKRGDVLIIEAETGELETFVGNSGAEIVGGRKFREDAEGSKDISTAEIVVRADSQLIGKTAAEINMRSKYGVNLLAVSRQKKQMRQQISNIRFKAGDVLLIQGRTHRLDDAISSMDCLPLAERKLRIGKPRKIFLSLGIFGGFVASAVTGILPVQIAFTFAALLLILTRTVSIREIYESIDWPIIVLLGAMIPIGEALETTGGADLLASNLLEISSGVPIWITLGILLLGTLFLSSVINNVATVVLMAPIGIRVASGLEASVDPFLMAIAVGASCAFLTPVGHQSNTLVMGPGGYTFSDYLRLGIPLTILIFLVGVPLIMIFWPT